MMMMEHDTAGQLLRELRALTSDYKVPPDACISYQTLYQALENFEKDLHQHIHLENNILFPKALELENTLNRVVMDRSTQAREKLSDDHEAVSEVLKQLLTALANKDVQSSYSTLDLLWARLAVHIRAEHLHLFPAVTSRLTEAQAVVDQLREDHDFFMRELARAIGILRETQRPIDSSDAPRETDFYRRHGFSSRETITRFTTTWKKTRYIIGLPRF